MNLPSEGWLFLAYAVGTGFGLWIGLKVSILRVTEATIDSLIENGFLKTRRNALGEVEILKYNEE
jgi:hypothetical protein